MHQSIVLQVLSILLISNALHHSGITSAVCITSGQYQHSCVHHIRVASAVLCASHHCCTSSAEGITPLQLQHCRRHHNTNSVVCITSVRYQQCFVHHIKAVPAPGMNPIRCNAADLVHQRVPAWRPCGRGNAACARRRPAVRAGVSVHASVSSDHTGAPLRSHSWPHQAMQCASGRRCSVAVAGGFPWWRLGAPRRECAGVRPLG